MAFSDELQDIVKKTSKEVERKPISDAQLNTIQSISINIPEDYLTYLRIVGAGDLTLSSIKIYPTLCDFSDFGLEEIYSVNKSIKFFGDNYSGDFLGFDLAKNKDEVLEFWHDSSSIHITGKTFREYIREALEGSY